ncbi:MAG: site-specific DNA-methyltransferase [Tepidisphaeraceae bacterium]|jgi:site-specific DNA-methyltransferase (adenine-specific)
MLNAKKHGWAKNKKLLDAAAKDAETEEQADNDSEKGAAVGLFDATGKPVVNQMLAGDCIKTLNEGPAGWIDLVFADPPFNIGYMYHGYDDRRKCEDYLQFSEDWMKAVHRALAPTGSFFLAIGDDYAADLCCIARRKLGFNMRNWIIWHYTFGQQTKLKFAKSHTHILYFTKDEKVFTFNPDAIRVASARQTTYGDVRANPTGKLPDDTWYLRPQETANDFFNPEGDTWYVSRVCGTFKERAGWHGCQMPLDVLNRVIASSSNAGDIVLDPFNGSGTTAVSAALLGRKYVGIDQSKAYVAFARKRLEETVAAVREEVGDKQLTVKELEELMSAIRRGTANSQVQTVTDAFGRARVERTYGRRRGRPAAAAKSDAVMFE